MSAKDEAVAATGLAAVGIEKVTNLLVNQPGPLPLSRSFASSGGPLLIFVSGSLSTPKPTRILLMNILFDGGQIGSCQVFTNVGSHMALVPVFLSVTGKPAGNHVIELRVDSSETYSDRLDYFNVTVIELKAA